MTAIDAHSFSVNFAYELCKILQAELVHILVPEVNDSVRVGWIEHLTGQNRMPQELSKDLWSRENVLAQSQ